MARMVVGKGIDQYISNLEALATKSNDMIGRSIYEGARIVADEVKRGIAAIPVGQPKNGYVTIGQKTGLYEGLGIARMQDDNGFLNVKIGMDGYNSLKTKKYPKGQPNAMIARSLEKGSSFAPARPFISPAVNRAKERAEKAMAEELDRQIRQMID